MARNPSGRVDHQRRRAGHGRAVPAQVDGKPGIVPGIDRPVVVALQTYGAIVADNGSAWFLGGVPDERWDNDALRALAAIKGSDFEAIDASSLMVSPTSGQVR